MAAAAGTQATEQWLLALSVPGALAGHGAAPAEPVAGAALLEALALHRTAPIAWRRLGGFPQLPAALGSALRVAQARNVAAAFTAVADIARIGAALDALALPWCVLKGVPLAKRHYGDPAARRVGDIDLLVAPQAVQAADAALRSAGCGRAGGSEPLPAPRYWHEQRYRSAGGLPVELHHRLHPNPRLFPVSTEQLLAGVARLPLGELAVPVLAPLTELLYLCSHGARHAWFRLLWVCDIAAIVAPASADFLAAAQAEARRLGLLYPLAAGLLLAEALLGAPPSPWAQALLRRSARLRYLMRHALERLWGQRDAFGNPAAGEHSSLLAALGQRHGMGFWAWELGLRARHEWQRRRPAGAGRGGA